MRSRRSRFTAGLSALAAMLFLQTAIACAPCGLPDRAAASAMAAAMAAMPDCQCAEQPSLGLAHCCTGEQAAMPSAQTQPAHPALPPETPAHAAPARLALRIERTDVSLAAAGPPPRILFQIFRL